MERPESPSGGRRVLQAGARISAEVSRRWFQALYETPLLFSGILDDRGVVLDANRLSVEGCGLVRDEVVGRPFWEGGWWHPDPQLSADVRGWCERALRDGEPFRTVSPYFLGGHPRTVDLALFPVRDTGPGPSYLVVTGLDITDAVAAQRERLERLAVSADASHRLAQSRVRELELTRQAERRADERLDRLVGVALDLLRAEKVEDLTAIVVDWALPVLGADGGAVAVRDGPGGLRLSVSDRLGEQAQLSYAQLPLDSPLPAAYSARTGDRLLLPTRAAGLAFSPRMAELYAATGRAAWAVFPLRVGERLLGSLTVSWRDEREFTADEVSLLAAFAAQCSQALDRIRTTRVQRENALAVQRLSETLQRSLLTQPPTPRSLDIAVRYQPAAHEAQIGGDWYDAFMTVTGATMLVVGDVSGHDRVAAAAMGQIRNVLRGLAYDTDHGPAVLLNRLDRALRGLEVDTLATAVLARVDQPAQGSPVRLLRWSNAGHPPPLLRRPDGRVELLDGTGDLLLGFRPDAVRGERVVELPDGSTLLLYTDGLVERRDASLDEGIGRIADLFARVGDRDPQEVCDALLTAVPDAHEDDIALLVLRAAPPAR